MPNPSLNARVPRYKDIPDGRSGIVPEDYNWDDMAREMGLGKLAKRVQGVRHAKRECVGGHMFRWIAPLSVIAFMGCVSDDKSTPTEPLKPLDPPDWSWVMGTWASVNPGTPADINYWHVETLNDSNLSGYLEEYTGAKRPLLSGSGLSGEASITLNTMDTATTCNDIWKPENALSRSLCISLDSTKTKLKPRLLSWQGYYSKSTGKITGEAKVSWNGGITWTDYVYPFVAQKAK